MRFYLSMLATIPAAIVLVAAIGCSDSSGPAPQNPPTQNIHWRGEDTGYQANASIGNAAHNGPLAGRR